MRQPDILKRSLDLLLVVPLVLACLPLWLCVAFLIKLETPGPVFFRQTRVGRQLRLFPMYKFRSMVADAEKYRERLEALNEMPGGVLFKMRRDPRVTRLGHVLRRWSIDETPQFLNVLLGHMSLVGPRPPLPEEVSRYSAEQLQRLQAKPGLTCLWQIFGRSEIPFEEQVALDIAYIRRKSLLLDLWILARTLPAIFGGKGAF